MFTVKSQKSTYLKQDKMKKLWRIIHKRISLPEA